MVLTRKDTLNVVTLKKGNMYQIWVVDKDQIKSGILGETLRETGRT